MPASYDTDDVIDAEILASEDRREPPRRAEAGLVLAVQARVHEPEPEPEPEPTLFTLPPELDPARLVADQQRVLEHMLATLEGRVPVPEPGEPAPLESSEEFLARAMAHLDRHMAAMDSALERIVGSRWSSPTPKR